MEIFALNLERRVGILAEFMLNTQDAAEKGSRVPGWDSLISVDRKTESFLSSSRIP